MVDGALTDKMNDRLRTRPDFAIIIRSGKFTRIALQPRIFGGSISSRRKAHACAEVRTGKNFIGLLNEETDDQRASAEVRTATARRTAQYVEGLVTAMSDRRSEAKQ